VEPPSGPAAMNDALMARRVEEGRQADCHPHRSPNPRPAPLPSAAVRLRFDDTGSNTQ